MTDEKDILDLDKLRKQFAGWEQVQQLIQEVEKLRSPSYYRKYMRVATPKDYVEQKKKIDSLTKERDRAVRQNKLYVLATESGQEWEIGERIEKLEAENAELKKWKSEWEDRYYRLEKSSLSEIASLKAQLSESQERVRELERLAVKKQWENIKQ